MEIRRRPSHKIRNISIFVLLLCIVYTLLNFKITQPKPIAATDVLAEATQITGVPSKASILPQVIQNELIGTKGSYGIAVIHLHTGERYLANEHRVYKSASLYKLWVMAAVFEKVKEGKLKETDVLTESIDSLNKKFNLAVPSPSPAPDGQPASIASPSAEALVSYTVSDALEKMITISDNYAALLLSSKVGISNVVAFLKKHELLDSKLGSSTGYPTVTPSDMALFWIKLYKGDLATHEHTEKMLGLLKRQRLNGKLPKYLPELTTIAHKTGELEDQTHDAGIVFGPNGEYLIVVLTESDSRLQAEERIANISKGVYGYFSQ